MSVPGIGPSLARRVYRELGVTSIEELRAAAQDGRLAELPGLGEKSAENIVQALWPRFDSRLDGRLVRLRLWETVNNKFTLRKL